MKVALVVQRFGKDIIGGAESHCYQLALRLSETLGWTVHVYTTTAFSYQTWFDFYPSGEEELDGLRIFRFKTVMSRSPSLFKFYNRIFSPLLEHWGRHPHKIPRIAFPFLRFFEKLWFILQGPWSPQLVNELVKRKNEYDQFVFFSYLYYPSMFGLPEIQKKCVLIPFAHPEPALNFPRVRALLKMSPFLYVNSEVEKSLVLEKGFSTEKRVKAVGCGLSEVFFNKASSFPRLSIPGLKKPYITYLGRISKAKGVSRLIQYFLLFIIQTKNEKLTLVLAGENDGSINIFYHPQIKFIGYISQEDKTSLLAHSACIVNPSPQESLPLLALEAIALQKPVLVNARCDILNYYAQQLRSVFAFNNNMEFSEHLNRILHLRKMDEFHVGLKESQQWVKERYSWGKILSAYENLLYEDKTELV